MFIVYILKSEDARIYIGYTNDVNRRLAEHNQQRSIATKHQKQWQLIYTESFSDRTLAMKREKFFKSGDGKKVLKSKGII